MIRALTKRIGKEHTRWLWWFWSWFLPSVILVAIGFKVLDSPDQFAMLQRISVVHWTGLVLCLALLPLNILLEAYKWKVILNPVDKKDIRACIKIILTGRSLDVITPFGIGNAFAKYISTVDGQRKQAIGGMLLENTSNLIPTLGFGAISCWYLLKMGLEVPFQASTTVWVVGSFVLIILVTVGFFFREKVVSYLTLLTELSFNSAIKIISLSICRYVVFTCQFYLLFTWLGTTLSNEVVVFGIAWIFLIKTILPGLSVMGDLVKREISAVLFFSFFTSQLGIVLVASFVIWLVNITLPAILGISFVKEYKDAF